LGLINYEVHLKKQPDWETRWENVQELISFAAQFDNERNAAQTPTPSQSQITRKEINDVEVINLVSDDDVIPDDTPREVSPTPADG